MASGSFGVTSNNGYIAGHIDWSESSVDVASNTSVVTATLYMSRTNSGYTTSGTGTWHIYINGQTFTATKAVSLTYNSNTMIVSGSTVVTHNADGSAYIGISCDGGISGTSYTATYGSSSVYLDTIPRASTISAFPAFNIDGSSAVTISRASASFTHNLYLYSGNTLIASWTGVATSLTLSLTSGQQDALYATIPNSTSVWVNLNCVTYNGGTQIGSQTVAYATATVPASIVPSFTAVTASENVSAVTTVMGAGKYIQGISRVNLAITGAQGFKSSTIASYKINVDGIDYNVVSAISNTILTSGTLTITGTITDSRGRTAVKTTTISVLPYTVPTVTGFTLSRCNSDGSANELGTYVKVISTGSSTSLVNSVEKNNLTYTVYSKLRTDSTYTSKKTLTIAGLALNASDVLSVYDSALAFDFKLTVADMFNTTTALVSLSTGAVPLSFSKVGIGVGKIWQQGALDVNGDFYLNNVKAVSTATANALALRDASGYLYATRFNTNCAVENTTATNYMYETNDGFLRKKSLYNVSDEISPNDKNRQAVMNGNFDVWQRGFSRIYGGYIADRWWNSLTAGTTLTASRQNFTAGQTEVPGNPSFFYRTAITGINAGTKEFLGQCIEDVRTYSGMSATLSFWAKADTSRTINVDLAQRFGTGGSAEVVVTAQNANLTTTWQKFTMTFAIPSLTGKTIGTEFTHYLYLRFNFVTGVTQTIDIAQVQFNEGTVALPYLQKTFEQELRDCQRFYEQSYHYGGIVGSSGLNPYIVYPVAGTGNVGSAVTFKVEKRIAPTVRCLDYVGNIDRCWRSGNNFAVTVTYVGTQGFYAYNVTVSSCADFGYMWIADADF